MIFSNKYTSYTQQWVIAVNYAVVLYAVCVSDVDWGLPEICSEMGKKVKFSVKSSKKTVFIGQFVTDLHVTWQKCWWRAERTNGEVRKGGEA